jgi:hypothetical protein
MNNNDNYPKVQNSNIIDNPLIPRRGVPVDQDMYTDSTKKIINPADPRSNPDNVTATADAHYVWNVDPSQFYGNGDNSGLAGIDNPLNTPKKFNLAQFNKEFENQKDLNKEYQADVDLNRLNKLSSVEIKTSLYDLSILDILVNTKNTWFNLMDDLLEQRFELATITKENRMFYIGVTILLFSIILYIYYIMSDEGDKTQTTSIKKVYHIYAKQKI